MQTAKLSLFLIKFDAINFIFPQKMRNWAESFIKQATLRAHSSLTWVLEGATCVWTHTVVEALLLLRFVRAVDAELTNPLNCWICRTTMTMSSKKLGEAIKPRHRLLIRSDKTCNKNWRDFCNVSENVTRYRTKVERNKNIWVKLTKKKLLV